MKVFIEENEIAPVRIGLKLSRAEGRSMKETAHILNVTPRTVAFHKYSIMELLHLRNNADLVRFAMRTPLLGGMTGLLAEG